MQRKPHVRTGDIEKGPSSRKGTRIRTRKAPARVEAGHGPEAENTDTTPASAPASPGTEGPLEMVDQAPEALADELRAAANEADGGTTGDGQTAQVTAEVIPANRPSFQPISLEEFWGLFVFVHGVGAMALHSEALRMGPQQPAARDACQALYETALETPSLHFLVDPANAQMKRWGAICAYGFSLVMAVRAERAMKRAEARARGPIPKPGSERPPEEHRAPSPDGTLSDG